MYQHRMPFKIRFLAAFSTTNRATLELQVVRRTRAVRVDDNSLAAFIRNTPTLQRREHAVKIKIKIYNILIYDL